MRVEAIGEWCLHEGTVLFYGNGGAFEGEPFERWRTYLNETSFVRYLGATGPVFRLSSVDRARGSGVFLNRKIPFAVVTDSVLVRGFTTAGSWLGLDIAAFAWRDVEASLRWLKVPSDRIPGHLEILYDLRDRVERELTLRETKRAAG